MVEGLVVETEALVLEGIVVEKLETMFSEIVDDRMADREDWRELAEAVDLTIGEAVEVTNCVDAAGVEVSVTVTTTPVTSPLVLKQERYEEPAAVNVPL